MMFHVLGVLCLIAFFKVLKRHRRHGGCRHHHRRHHRRNRSMWRRGLDVAFDRLDTSPGQEKEIRSATSTFLDDAIPARRELKRAVQEILATALGEEIFDEDAVRQALTEQEDRITGLRESLLALLKRVHDALDEEQRAQLAAFAGRRFAPTMGGPYR